jgi:hypothetical protein
VRRGGGGPAPRRAQSWPAAATIAPWTRPAHDERGPLDPAGGRLATRGESLAQKLTTAAWPPPPGPFAAWRPSPRGVPRAWDRTRRPGEEMSPRGGGSGARRAPKAHSPRALTAAASPPFARQRHPRSLDPSRGGHGPGEGFAGRAGPVLRWLLLPGRRAPEPAGWTSRTPFQQPNAARAAGPRLVLVLERFQQPAGVER